MSVRFDDALAYLYSFIDYERNPKWSYDRDHFDLSRMKGLLTALGSPHRSGWFVHVAGTNGKGSVASMISRALREQGYRTGLYTSPHLVTFRERIRVDGAMISPEETADAVERIRPVAETFERLTFFDVWTALAFDYFARKECDVAVIEVGMGGRLDSTNVIEPAVSVITPVARDHAGKLGDTLPEIAREKAGIIKQGVPVVSAAQDTGVLEVIEARAAECNALLTVAGRDIICRYNGDAVSYEGPSWKFAQINVPLHGYMQQHNAALAIAALETLNSSGRTVHPVSAQRGIENVRWPGRLQTVALSPDVIVDGACNPAAMNRVREYITARSPREKTVAVVSMCGDKEVDTNLEILAGAVHHVIATRTANPRTLPADVLASRCPDTVTTGTAPDIAAAAARAAEFAGTDGLIIVTGSLYLVGEAMSHFGVDALEQL